MKTLGRVVKSRKSEADYQNRGYLTEIVGVCHAESQKQQNGH